MDDFNLSRILFGSGTPEPSATNIYSASVVEMVAVTSSNHGVVIVKSAEEDMNEIFESGEPGVDFIELDDDGSFDEAEVEDEGPIDDSAIDETDGDGVDVEGEDYSAYSVAAYHAAAVALAEEEEENEDDPVPGEDLSATDEIDDGDATEPEDPGDPSLDDPVPDENLVSAEVDDSEYTLTDDSGIDDDTGEEVEISDGTAEVETTVSVRAGDRVMVSVQNGKMTVVGVIGGGDIAEAETALAQEAADEAAADALEAKTAADAAQAEAEAAKQAAADAKAKAELVETNMAGINAEVSNIKQDAAAIRNEIASSIEAVKTEASTTYATKTELSTTESTLRKETSDSVAEVQTTMSQDYAKKTEVSGAIVDAKAELQTQITQNANELKSVASSVEAVKVDVTANATGITEAKQAASEAQTLASTAKTASDKAAQDLATAQGKLAEVESNANATAEDLETAKSAVTAAASAAQEAKTAADAAQAAADRAAQDLAALDGRITTAETSITQNSEAIELRATKTELNETNERVTSSESVIEQLSDSLASMVRDGDETSLVKQDANGLFYFDVGAIQNSANETANKLSGLLDAIGDVDYESGETILGKLSEMETTLNAVGFKTEYVTVSTYNDEPCIILGESDSAFKLLITNTRIVFLEGSTETTYIMDNTLVTNNVEVKNELRQGSWKWSARANGNLGLIWTGGAE